MRTARLAVGGVRLAAAGVYAARLAGAARTHRPLDPGTGGDTQSVSVVIPARDEAARIGPCLTGLAGEHVLEVVVVDDESSDDTAAIARGTGARVVPGRPLPAGWTGKPWALQQGLEAAAGERVLFLDADTRPRPGLVGALCARADADGWDLLSAGGRFQCDEAAERWLHPALLATLVARFGPPGRRPAPPAARTIVNGQCVLVRRRRLLDEGGFAPIRDHLTDDIALARHLARCGWRVGFLDGAAMLDVEMYRGAADAWRNWGRSLPMPDVTSPLHQAADLLVVWVALGLPLPRLAARRADAIDIALLALRAGLLFGTARAYARRGVPYWLSPLADPLAAARLTYGALRPGRSWRGRTYERRP